MKRALIIVVGLFSTGAVAGQPLWQNVEAGMTTEQIEALYPAVKGEITHKPKVSILENMQQVARCHPDVHVEHPAGTVTKVIVYSRYRGFPKESCGDEAEAAMLGKYGKPTSQDQNVQEEGGVITGGFLKGFDTTRNVRDTKSVWIKDGVLITFERADPEMDDIWKITYEPVQDIGL
jgi:hypothetical protein